MSTYALRRESIRIALYSHDTMGFGHVRRNLLVARRLVAPPLRAKVLLIAGVREAGAFTMPPGVDCLTLPAYQKDGNGRYHSRSLGIDTPSLVGLRSATIDAALDQFAPDLFVVDNVPRGAMSELNPVLGRLAESGRARCVLGLRDVLDDPATVARQWWAQRNAQAIEDWYDEVWVYGDPRLYDAGLEYGFDPVMRAKTHYLGYLDQTERLAPGVPHDPALAACQSDPSPYALCVVGGGQDGLALAKAFAHAKLPSGHRGVIVTGPFMPPADQAAVRHCAAGNPQLSVLEFVTEPIQLVLNAARIVAMGGYNTVSEILSFGKQALIVPRVSPRTEQLIRAERLQAAGLIDLLHPERLCAEALSAWLCGPDRRSGNARELLDFGGLACLQRRVQSLLAEQRVAQIVRRPAFEFGMGELRHAAG